MLCYDLILSLFLLEQFTYIYMSSAQMDASCSMMPVYMQIRGICFANTAAADRMDHVVYRRARHVITENRRCELGASALEAGDFKTFGRLMIESHNSLRFETERFCWVHFISKLCLDCCLPVFVKQRIVFQ